MMKSKVRGRRLPAGRVIGAVCALGLTTAGLSACSDADARMSKPAKRVGNQLGTTEFSNDFISFEYPAGFEVQDNFYMAPLSIDDIKKLSPEQIGSMPTNQLLITPRAADLHGNKPELSFVMSTTKFDFTLRDHMEFSIGSKESGLAQEDGLTYLGFTEIDSLTVAGYPALRTDFGYLSETGDTLVMRQYVMQKPDFTLFYFNIRCNVNAPQALEQGDRIVSTIKVK